MLGAMLLLAAAAATAAEGGARTPFINRGGTVKYAAWSVLDAGGDPASWSPAVVSGRALSDCDAYRQGEEPTHYVCLPKSARRQLSDQALAPCRAACAADASCSVAQWQGARAHNFSADDPGQCFLYQSCDSAGTYTTKLAKDFCMDIAEIRRGAAAEVVIGQVQKHPRNPLIVQDKPWDARWDNGYPNVEYAPGAAGGDFQVWYGGFITCKCDKGSGHDRVNAWHYANSTDGLSWRKPELGILDLAKVKYATPAMKAAGTRNNVLMSPSDGMGMLRDPRDANASRRYKAFGTGCFGPGGDTGCTHGSGFSADGLHFTDPTEVDFPSPQRWDDHQNIFFDEVLKRYVLTTRDGFSSSPGRSIAVSLGGEDGSFGGWGTPALTFEGTDAHQLYSQVTWRYYNVYLGIVMVFDTEDAGTVGTVRCRLAWSPTAQGTWRWVAGGGLTGPEIIPISGVGSPAFDSHICFAAHKPAAVGGAVRLYYMGGNGPHNGPRNSSLGLATLRMDGFAGVRAGADGANVTTVPLPVAGAALIATVDILAPGGSVCIGVKGSSDVGPAACVPLTANATDAAVRFRSGATLAGLVGQRAALQLVVRDAVVYTFGFAGAQ